MIDKVERLLILGLPCANVTLDEAVEFILHLIDQYQIDKKPKYVATVNFDFLVKSWGMGLTKAHDPELLRILRASDLVTADGMSLVWLSHWLGQALKERVTGQDLFPKVASALHKRGGSLFLLGGSQDVAEKASELLQKEYPTLKVTGVLTPDIHDDGSCDEKIIDTINEAAPDVLFIQLGNPKQELWFDRNKDKIKVAVSIGVGGTFERYTGFVRRAPLWMQKWGLEWFFRFISEPRRLWRRYVVDLLDFAYVSIPLVFIHRFHIYFPSSKNGRESHFDHIIYLPSVLDKENANRWLEGLEMSRIDTPIVFDFKALRHADLSGLYVLFALWRKLTEEKREFYGVGVQKHMKIFFKEHRLWDILEQKMR